MYQIYSSTSTRSTLSLLIIRLQCHTITEFSLCANIANYYYIFFSLHTSFTLFTERNGRYGTDYFFLLILFNISCYDTEKDNLTFTKVDAFLPNKIYYHGCLKSFLQISKWNGPEVV